MGSEVFVVIVQASLKPEFLNCVSAFLSSTCDANGIATVETSDLTYAPAYTSGRLTIHSSLPLSPLAVIELPIISPKAWHTPHTQCGADGVRAVNRV